MRSCTLQVCCTPLSQRENTRFLSLVCHSLALFTFICFVARCLGKAAYHLLLRYRFVSKPGFSFLWGAWDFSSENVRRCVDMWLSRHSPDESWMLSFTLLNELLSPGLAETIAVREPEHRKPLTTHCCSSNMLSWASLCNQMLLFPYCQKSRKSSWLMEGLWLPKGNTEGLFHRLLLPVEGPPWEQCPILGDNVRVP